MEIMYGIAMPGEYKSTPIVKTSQYISKFSIFCCEDKFNEQISFSFPGL